MRTTKTAMLAEMLSSHRLWLPRAKALRQALEERISRGVLNEIDGKGQGVAAFVAIDLTVVLCTPLPNRSDDKLDVFIGQGNEGLKHFDASKIR
ncbi:hypothetical protein GR216_00330 [Rhizobium leguminosarum]|nr:hypothetical protein [Rhizobium ruizarguesonis]NEJ33929.1 hypothetical protein [Rhizobium ruizarguesonis]